VGYMVMDFFYIEAATMHRVHPGRLEDHTLDLRPENLCQLFHMLSTTTFKVIRDEAIRNNLPAQ